MNNVISSKPYGYKYMEIVFRPLDYAADNYIGLVIERAIYTDYLLHAFLWDKTNNMVFQFQRVSGGLNKWNMKTYKETIAETKQTAFWYERHDLSDEEQLNALKRAYTLTFRETFQYDLIFNNCQQVIYEVVYGKRFTGQSIFVLNSIIEFIFKLIKSPYSTLKDVKYKADHSQYDDTH